MHHDRIDQREGTGRAAELYSMDRPRRVNAMRISAGEYGIVSAVGDGLGLCDRVEAQSNK